MAGKIGFVGVGAVGSYYGLMLKKAGEDVHLLLRSNYDAVKKNGFELVGVATSLCRSASLCIIVS